MKTSKETLAIREYLTKHPDATPSSVIAALKPLKITSQRVSNQKLRMRNNTPKPKTTPPAIDRWGLKHEDSQILADLIGKYGADNIVQGVSFLADLQKRMTSRIAS